MSYENMQVRQWHRHPADLTHEDLHVSEPVSAFVAEMAQAVADMPSVERLDALLQLAEAGYDAAGIEHAMHHVLVKRAVQTLNMRARTRNGLAQVCTSIAPCEE